MSAVEALPAIILGVVRSVVKVGDVPKTATPVPVSSERELSKYEEVAVETRFFEASEKIAREAVRSERLIVPEEVIPVKPVAAPAVETFQLLELI